MERQWYALVAAPQKEYVTRHILERWGAWVFVPTETRKHRRNRYVEHKSEIAHAAISGLIFAGFIGEPDWPKVRGLPTISGVVSIGDVPARLDTAKLLKWLGSQIDGRMEWTDVHETDGTHHRERGVYIQGRGIVLMPKAQRYIKARYVTTATGRIAKVLQPLMPDEKRDAPMAVLSAAA